MQPAHDEGRGGLYCAKVESGDCSASCDARGVHQVVVALAQDLWNTHGSCDCDSWHGPVRPPVIVSSGLRPLQSMASEWWGDLQVSVGDVDGDAVLHVVGPITQVV